MLGFGTVSRNEKKDNEYKRLKVYIDNFDPAGVCVYEREERRREREGEEIKRERERERERGGRETEKGE